MIPYQQRVVVEREELHNKIIALEKFLHGPTMHSLDVDEQDRLRLQLSLMKQLEVVLAQRIQHFLEAA